MDAYEALYATRAMRRVKPDPIPQEVWKRMLDAAIREPGRPGHEVSFRNSWGGALGFEIPEPLWSMA